jgi:RNA polymerase subunit RPABC4/transcription elongation factor Spt4
MYCTNCKALQNEDVKFCSVCGKDLRYVREESDSYCSDCNSYVPANARFCWSCSVALDEEEDDLPLTDSVAVNDAVKQSKSLKANKSIVLDHQCSHCHAKFNFGEEVRMCGYCLEYYHEKCWEVSGGCGNQACNPDMKACQFCGKEVKASAIKCRHCGLYLDGTIAVNTADPVKLGESTNSLVVAIIGFIVLWFLAIIGIICAVSAITMANKAIKKIDSEPGWTGKGDAQAALVIAWISIGIIAVSYIILFAAI